MEKYTFPSGFLWGTATSSHQIEGNNTKSDWYRWETKEAGKPGGPVEGSGTACDSYNRFEEDFEIAGSLHQNAHRLSLEWSRIETSPGVFSEEETLHYRKVLESLKKRGIKTFVTLHHFTNPIWFSDLGGWENKESPIYFKRYAAYCAQNFGDLVDYWMTINEPTVYTYMSYIFGAWVPCKKNFFPGIKVFFNLAKAHKESYQIIKQYLPHSSVSFAHQAVRFNPYRPTWIDRLAATIQNIFMINFVLYVFKPFDFIGLNYYVEAKASVFKVLYDFNNGITDMGWPVSGRGLYDILLVTKAWNKDVYITENGISIPDDDIRKAFIIEHLLMLLRAIEMKVPVKGYMYWSLLDNYEWDKGYSMKFGIVEIDRANHLERKVRESGLLYSEICRSNGLDFLKESPYFVSLQNQVLHHKT